MPTWRDTSDTTSDGRNHYIISDKEVDLQLDNLVKNSYSRDVNNLQALQTAIIGSTHHRKAHSLSESQRYQRQTVRDMPRLQVYRREH